MPPGNPGTWDRPFASRSHVSWGAIFAGATAAVALQVLFMMLGAGLGLSIYSPITEQNPVSNFSVGALVIHSIGALIALALGGWVAGRFSPVHTRATGWLHGFCVWCTATVAGVIMVASGASAMLGGVVKVAEGGLSMVGESATAVAKGATEAAEQSGVTLKSFADEAVGNLPNDGPAGEKVRATREVSLALGRLFNPVQNGDSVANRTAVVRALVDHAKMSEAEANRAVTEWTTTFERVKADLGAAKAHAEKEAREAADAAANALAKFSLLSFFAFLLGALLATGGGHLGAKSATNCDTKNDSRLSYAEDASDDAIGRTSKITR